MKVFFNKFHRRINLVAILFSNLGSRNKTTIQNFEILSPKGTFHTNFDSEWGNDSFVQQISHRINLVAFYLPHMEYKGSIGLVTGKMKNFYC
jgi:hypothetical protein